MRDYQKPTSQLLQQRGVLPHVQDAPHAAEVPPGDGAAGAVQAAPRRDGGQPRGFIRHGAGSALNALCLMLPIFITELCIFIQSGASG